MLPGSFGVWSSVTTLVVAVELLTSPVEVLTVITSINTETDTLPLVWKIKRDLSLIAVFNFSVSVVIVFST